VAFVRILGVCSIAIACLSAFGLVPLKDGGETAFLALAILCIMLTLEPKKDA
jgi:hypothetical protein